MSVRLENVMWNEKNVGYRFPMRWKKFEAKWDWDLKRKPQYNKSKSKTSVANIWGKFLEAVLNSTSTFDTLTL